MYRFSALSQRVHLALPSIVEGFVLPCLLLTSLTALTAGCGSAVQTTLPKEWEAEVGENTQTLAVDRQREHLIVGKNKETTIYDDSGTRILGEDDSGLSGMLSNVSSAVSQSSPFSADKLDYVVLSDPGIALVFDYTSDDDIVRALNLDTGSEMWKRTDYRWSLEKYQSVGSEIAEGLLQNANLQAGAGALAATGVANATLLRERFVYDLVAEVPNQNAILLKTVGELRLVDLETGNTEWRIDDVSGSSLIHTSRLPSGDMILATNYTSILERASGGREVLRIDARDGTVQWRSDHDADAVRHSELKDNLLLLQHGDKDLEAFRVDDGTEVFDVEMDWRADVVSYRSASYRGEDYQVSYTEGPKMTENAVYVPHLANIQTIGAPDYGVKRFNLNSGDQTWASEPVSEMHALQDLTIQDNLLIARAFHWGGGALGSDPRQRVLSWDLSDGTMEWNHRTPYDPSKASLVRSQVLGDAPPSSYNLVVDQGRAYAATDTSIVAYTASNGSLYASAGAESSGQPVWLTKQDDILVDLRTMGVGFHAKSDLTPVAEPISFASEVITYNREGSLLLVRTENGLYVVDLGQQSLVGTVAQEDAGGFVSGNLRSGFVVTEGGESVFVLTPDWVVQKYRIP